jgi:hypothetical protein
MSSTTGSIGSGASTSGASTSSPPCPTCGVNVEAAFSKIDIARRKLQLRQETLQTEQALLKADKRNFKRRLKAAKLAAANSQIQVERIQAEAVASEQAAKRKHQEYQQQLEEVGSEKQKESEKQHQQELQFLKQEIEELFRNKKRATKATTPIVEQEQLPRHPNRNKNSPIAANRSIASSGN